MPGQPVLITLLNIHGYKGDKLFGEGLGKTYLNPEAPIENKRFVWIRNNIWDQYGFASEKLNRLSMQCPITLLDTWQYGKHTVRFEQYDCRFQGI